MQKFIFDDQLPFDIIKNIFSHLNQHDALTCMAVCKDWYDQIPHYTTDIWQTVRFSERSIHPFNKRRQKCLGNHVKNVIFDKFEGEDLYDAMQYVLDNGCNELQSIEFFTCLTKDHDIFLQFLQYLASHLLILAFEEHKSNLSLLHVLDVCPELVHFTYIPSSYSWDKTMFNGEPSIKRQFSTHDLLFTNLRYLYIGCPLDAHMRLQPLLQRCPHLQYFIGANADAYEMFFGDYKFDLHDLNLDSSLDLDLMFSLCPRLTYFKSNCSFDSDISLRIMDKNDIVQAKMTGRQQNDNGTIGLQHLSVCEEDYKYPQIAELLKTKCWNTLEFLDLVLFFDEEYEADNWTNLFKSIHMTRLKTLICRYILCDIASIFIMLNHCPLIDEVQLVFDCNPIKKVINQSVLEQMGTLYTLRSIALHNFSFNDEFSFVGFLEKLPVLEELILADSSLILNNNPNLLRCFRRLRHLYLNDVGPIATNSGSSTTFLTPDFFHNMITFDEQQPRFESIRLRFVPCITLELLAVISGLQTLKKLDIRLDKPVKNTSEDQDHLLGFVHELVRCKSEIEELYIEQVSCLSYNILEKLGDLLHLRTLRLGCLSLTIDSKPKLEVIDLAGLATLLLKQSKNRFIGLNKICFSAVRGIHINSRVVREYLLDEGISSWTVKCTDQYQPSYRLDNNGAIPAPTETFVIQRV
ncbi:hypothetical protein BDA99DRAFT_608258 [Phascolomyces articulosus]|uniref:F-box domain-containing protein n=1 Tax=Phascolomyces articulosus TaxID=60185 RepID=A0AAD5K4V0_9FUNG|nr:hypothetical protein BDA99DRAFT_608258 [Phascolomyces articulosus]